MRVSPEDHARIAEAVAKAEQGTAGEIACVLAEHSAEYGETPFLWAGAAAILAPALALAGGWTPERIVNLSGGWTVELPAAAGLWLMLAAQAVLFVVVAILVALPSVRRLLTPPSRRAQRVRQAALAQFYAQGMHLTRGRTGVLIYASRAERRAEVIADEGIFTVAPEHVWDEVLAALVKGLADGRIADGFVAAVERTGSILAQHAPPIAGDNPNERPDGLVEVKR